MQKKEISKITFYPRKDFQRETLYSKMVKKICDVNKVIHVLIAIAALCIGFLFNTIDEMPIFYIKGLLGAALYLFLVFTIIYANEQNYNLDLALKEDPLLKKYRCKYNHCINSNINFLFCLIACTYFDSISIILGFVEFNPIGIYSLFALFCVVFLAFIIFQQYIHILFLLSKISKSCPEKINEILPEKTKWFCLLEKYSNVCRNMFIILGSLFIILFTIFSPINNIYVLIHEKKESLQFIFLSCTWIIIFIAIIFMIPLSSYIRTVFLKKIYENLSQQSIRNYKKQYDLNEEFNKLIYIDIILHLNDRKYDPKNSFASLFPILLSFIDYTSIIISLIGDLKELGLLT